MKINETMAIWPRTGLSVNVCIEEVWISVYLGIDSATRDAALWRREPAEIHSR
jgi:hypothetical protein